MVICVFKIRLYNNTDSKKKFFKGLGNQKPELENLVFITSQTNDSIKHHSRRHNRGLNIDQTILSGQF